MEHCPDPSSWCELMERALITRSALKSLRNKGASTNRKVSIRELVVMAVGEDKCLNMVDTVSVCPAVGESDNAPDRVVSTNQFKDGSFL